MNGTRSSAIGQSTPSWMDDPRPSQRAPLISSTTVSPRAAFTPRIRYGKRQQQRTTVMQSDYRPWYVSRDEADITSTAVDDCSSHTFSSRARRQPITSASFTAATSRSYHHGDDGDVDGGRRLFATPYTTAPRPTTKSTSGALSPAEPPTASYSGMEVRAVGHTSRVEGRAQSSEQWEPQPEVTATTWATLHDCLRSRTHSSLVVTLDLTATHLSASQWSWLCEEILPQLHALEALVLARMGLSDTDARALMSACLQITKTKSTAAGSSTSSMNRNIESSSTAQLHAVLPRLRVLDVSGNELTHRSATYLGKMIVWASDTIDLVRIRANPLKDYGFQVLGVYLSKLTINTLREEPHLFPVRLVRDMYQSQREERTRGSREQLDLDVSRVSATSASGGQSLHIGPSLLDARNCCASARGLSDLLSAASRAHRLKCVLLSHNVPPPSERTATPSGGQQRSALVASGDLLSLPPFSNFSQMNHPNALADIILPCVPLSQLCSPAGCRELLLNIFFCCASLRRLDVSESFEITLVSDASMTRALSRTRTASTAAEEENDATGFLMRDVSLDGQCRVGDVMAELFAHAAYNAAVRRNVVPSAFSQVQELYLNATGLTDQGARAIAVALRHGNHAGMLQSLRVLSLTHNLLTATGCVDVIRAVSGGDVQHASTPLEGTCATALMALSLQHNCGVRAEDAAGLAAIEAAVESAMNRRSRAQRSQSGALPLGIHYGASNGPVLYASCDSQGNHRDSSRGRGFSREPAEERGLRLSQQRPRMAEPLSRITDVSPSAASWKRRVSDHATTSRDAVSSGAWERPRRQPLFPPQRSTLVTEAAESTPQQDALPTPLVSPTPPEDQQKTTPRRGADPNARFLHLEEPAAQQTVNKYKSTREVVVGDSGQGDVSPPPRLYNGLIDSSPYSGTYNNNNEHHRSAYIVGTPPMATDLEGIQRKEASPSAVADGRGGDGVVVGDTLRLTVSSSEPRRSTPSSSLRRHDPADRDAAPSPPLEDPPHRGTQLFIDSFQHSDTAVGHTSLDEGRRAAETGSVPSKPTSAIADANVRPRRRGSSMRSFVLLYNHPPGHMLCRAMRVLQSDREVGSTARAAAEADILDFLQPSMEDNSPAGAAVSHVRLMTEDLIASGAVRIEVTSNERRSAIATRLQEHMNAPPEALRYFFSRLCDVLDTLVGWDTVDEIETIIADSLDARSTVKAHFGDTPIDAIVHQHHAPDRIAFVLELLGDAVVRFTPRTEGIEAVGGGSAVLVDQPIEDVKEPSPVQPHEEEDSGDEALVDILVEESPSPASTSTVQRQMKDFVLSYAHQEGGAVCRAWRALHNRDALGDEARACFTADMLVILHQTPHSDSSGEGGTVSAVEILQGSSGVSSMLQLRVSTNMRRVAVASRLQSSALAASPMTGMRGAAREAVLTSADDVNFPALVRFLKEHPEMDTLRCVAAYLDVPGREELRRRLTQGYRRLASAVHYHHGTPQALAKELSVPSLDALTADEISKNGAPLLADPLALPAEDEASQQSATFRLHESIDASSESIMFSVTDGDEEPSSLVHHHYNQHPAATPPRVSDSDPSAALHAGQPPISRSNNEVIRDEIIVSATTRASSPRASTIAQMQGGGGAGAGGSAASFYPGGNTPAEYDDVVVSSTTLRNGKHAEGEDSSLVPPPNSIAAKEKEAVADAESPPTSSQRAKTPRREWEKLLESKHRRLMRVAYEGMVRGSIPLDPQSQQKVRIAKGRWGNQKVVVTLEWEILLVLYFDKPKSFGNSKRAQMLVHPVACGFTCRPGEPAAAANRRSSWGDDKQQHRLLLDIQRPFAPEALGVSVDAMSNQLLVGVKEAGTRDKKSRKQNRDESSVLSGAETAMVDQLLQDHILIDIALSSQRHVDDALKLLFDGVRRATQAIEKSMSAAIVSGGPIPEGVRPLPTVPQ